MIVTLFSPMDSIQQELWDLFRDNIIINIIINGHNSNKFNTIVRQVFNNTILGPYDLIKTQLLRHKLRYGSTPLYLLLNHNFTSLRPKEYIESRLDALESNIKNIFNELLSVYFSYKKSLLSTNFNIGCILYATLFYIKGVDETINIMNTILKIPREVYYHSNKPLQLKVLPIPEEDINEIYFTDYNGLFDLPDMNKNIIDIINNSNIIIFSELLPTFKTKDFYTTIKSSKASLYMIKDKIEPIYDRFIPVEKINFITNIMDIFQHYYQKYMDYDHFIIDSNIYTIDTNISLKIIKEIELLNIRTSLLPPNSNSDSIYEKYNKDKILYLTNQNTNKDTFSCSQNGYLAFLIIFNKLNSFEYI